MIRKSEFVAKTQFLFFTETTSAALHEEEGVRYAALHEEEGVRYAALH